MAGHNLSTRLDFLTDAAHLLAATAPETSAHLMRQRNGFLIEQGQEPSDVQRQHVCTSCGHIMIPGDETELKVETVRLRRKKRKTPDASKAARPTEQVKGHTSKILTCGKCGRYTKISFAPPPDRAATRRRPLPEQQLSTGASTSKPSQNASSKKRAKARKAGLQALLQQDRNSGPGNDLNLSLTDFMKK